MVCLRDVYDIQAKQETLCLRYYTAKCFERMKDLTVNCWHSDFDRRGCTWLHSRQAPHSLSSPNHSDRLWGPNSHIFKGYRGPFASEVKQSRR